MLCTLQKCYPYVNFKSEIYTEKSCPEETPSFVISYFLLLPFIWTASPSLRTLWNIGPHLAWCAFSFGNLTTVRTLKSVISNHLFIKYCNSKPFLIKNHLLSLHYTSIESSKYSLDHIIYILNILLWQLWNLNTSRICRGFAQK